MSVLDVPGARLYYETRGSGPLLLMVPGANGNADVFTSVAKHLATYYTVVTYDRRGFSRSQLDGPQDYEHRLATDADDVRLLIEHLSEAPATVFGTSSGAVVALETLTRHPSTIRTLVPYEPAALRQLPDGQEWMDFVYELYDLYRQSGPRPALRKFREYLFTASDRQLMTRAMDLSSEQVLANATYWFEHELRQYSGVALELAALTAHADRIVPAVGRESRGYPAYEVNVELGARLGCDVIELPGGHAGFAAEPTEFARHFLQALEHRGHGPTAV